MQREVMRSAAVMAAADLGRTGPPLDALKLMMQGKQRGDLSRAHLSEHTVKNLVAAILKALKKFGRG